jgi:putative FmdB family regulatory protein
MKHPKKRNSKMPVYEFECPCCGLITEKICIFKEAVKGEKCTRCDSPMKMVISAVNFHTDETRARRILSKGRKANGKARK